MRRMSANNAAVERVIAHVKSVYGRWRRDTTPAQMRADWDELFHARGDAAVSDVAANGVHCRWHTAAGAGTDRAVLYFHGGGFQVGSLDSHREIMSLLSRFSGARVLGVGYRLAPDNRYPAAHEDAMTAFEWLQTQGFEPRHIALAGDSAGGGLALSLALALQQRGGALPAACYVMSAWTDLTASGESYESRASLDPIHQKPMIVAMARNYLGREQDPADARVSPLMAPAERLAKLPPVLLQVGERETVVSDSEQFARKVQGAGGQAELQVWSGMIHVFQQFPADLPEARDALMQGGAFLAARLGMHSPEKSHP
jgi:acetyl esterase/lipase